ncbi:PorT family protein [Mucilaginibacter sp. RS28]|uniref:PorT family protein n=1 Tax=Mucilaginibacter straminoryzae TaxID=2932774 RepID=A0A9X2BD69_9SPHI|nr:porin family protein [Mucilaginibacter straminoryzae]MCJ8209958.1 PorT family protein [Mucilaginibacter straminoryzae]
MKHILYIFFLLLSIPGFAQKWGYGLKVGGGIANQSVTNKEIIEVNSIRTFNAGGFVKYYLKEDLLLQAGINYSEKGAQVVEDAITTTSRIKYADVPLNLVKRFNFSGLGKIFIGGGAFFARALSGKYKYETPNSVTSDDLEIGNDKYLQRYDYGLNITSGLELDNHLLFDLRYAFGMKNLSTPNLKDTGTSAIKSRLLVLSLGYVLH